jgi:hypothetical protein
MNYLKTLAVALLLTATAFAAPPAVEQAASDSTAMVYSHTVDNKAFRGSAVYFGEGLFITNHHVIDRAKQVWIQKPGTSLNRPATIIAVDVEADIAILIVSGEVTHFKPVKFIAFDKHIDRVWASGYGSSCHDDVEGHFMRVYGGGQPDWMPKQADTYRFAGDEGCSISGDSGGPAFNKDGEFISVIWGTDGKNTYAVTPSYLRKLLFPILLEM